LHDIDSECSAKLDSRCEGDVDNRCEGDEDGSGRIRKKMRNFDCTYGFRCNTFKVRVN